MLGWGQYLLIKWLVCVLSATASLEGSFRYASSKVAIYFPWGGYLGTVAKLRLLANSDPWASERGEDERLATHLS